MGWAWTEAGRGGEQIGLEFSLVHLNRRSAWSGLFVGATWDGAAEVARLVVGPELGQGFAGLDAGVSVNSKGQFGGRVRAVLTVGLVGVYGGLGIERESRVECGLLLKLPWEG